MSAKIIAFGFRSALVASAILGGIWLGQRVSPLTRVSGNSMAPAIRDGEIFTVSHQISKEIPRGAIVIIGRFARLPLIKRVVGLPHETVSFKLGEVFVDGKMLYEPYLPISQTTFSWNRDTIATRDEEYVVLGDNRLVSQDSREYGVVSRKQIIGVIDLPCLPARFLDRPRFRILAGLRNPDQVVRTRTHLGQGPT